MIRTLYLIVADNQNKCFYRADGEWSAEYPDAALFPSQGAAKRAATAANVRCMIYSDKGYQEGTGPVAHMGGHLAGAQP